MTDRTVPPTDDLDALIEHILSRLAGAVRDRDAPWRAPMLASVTRDREPTLRTVVIRAIDAAERRLRINTDRRSDKADQLAADSRVELGFWDPVAQQQLRVAGRAELTTDGPAVDAAWAALGPEGREVYRSGARPGAPIGRADDAGPGPVEPDGPSSGRQAIAVVTILWERWDWLWLGPNGHRRARVHWTADGQRQARWVVP